MIRLAVTVEGATERNFVNRLLGPHLQSREIYPSAILLGSARSGTGVGGNVTVERVASDMADHYHSFDFVTSLVDFYGFRDKGTRTVDQLEQDIVQGVGGRLRPNWDRTKVIPYVQLHEFEGLLFSLVSSFIDVPGASEAALQQLGDIRSLFPSPEEINDNPNTAPSKRIWQMLPEYVKTVDGPQIAQTIGLPAIRAQCPRFNQWVTRLESLSA